MVVKTAFTALSASTLVANLASVCTLETNSAFVIFFLSFHISLCFIKAGMIFLSRPPYISNIGHHRGLLAQNRDERKENRIF